VQATSLHDTKAGAMVIVHLFPDDMRERREVLNHVARHFVGG
jgi:hypothetical protein